MVGRRSKNAGKAKTLRKKTHLLTIINTDHQYAPSLKQNTLQTIKSKPQGKSTKLPCSHHHNTAQMIHCIKTPGDDRLLHKNNFLHFLPLEKVRFQSDTSVQFEFFTLLTSDVPKYGLSMVKGAPQNIRKRKISAHCSFSECVDDWMCLQAIFNLQTPISSPFPCEPLGRRASYISGNFSAADGRGDGRASRVSQESGNCCPLLGNCWAIGQIL